MAFKKGFHLFKFLLLLLDQCSIFKLIYERFPKISKRFHTYFTKEYKCDFPEYKGFSKVFMYTFTC